MAFSHTSGKFRNSHTKYSLNIMENAIGQSDRFLQTRIPGLNTELIVNPKSHYALRYLFFAQVQIIEVLHG